MKRELFPRALSRAAAFHTPTKLYYLMDFCNGGDLAYLLWRCKRLQEEQARFYIGEVFLALQVVRSTCQAASLRLAA